jgi:hypothetical protein
MDEGKCGAGENEYQATLSAIVTVLTRAPTTDWRKYLGAIKRSMIRDRMTGGWDG